jgi:ribosomal protein S18 acetylase RimI-like enzyme
VVVATRHENKMGLHPAIQIIKPDRRNQMQIDYVELTMTNYQNVISLWKNCEGIGLSSADSQDRMHAYLRRNPGMNFVAKYQNEIIGAVLCGHDGRRGYLHHLAVHPAYRNQGIGRSLVDRCVTALQRIGIQKCHLFIFNSNMEGIQFWEKIGWSPRNDIRIVSKEITKFGT